MQILPSVLLSKIVKHYLWIESEQSSSLRYRLFSDGNPGIVFHLKSPLLQFDKNNGLPQVQPRSFIYGQITRYNNIALSGKLGMLVVVLQPYGIYTLAGIDAHELNNYIINLADVFGNEAFSLEDQVLSAPDINTAIVIIEYFLLKQSLVVGKTDALVNESLKLINCRNGGITIESLLKTLSTTEKQLERRFKNHIGLSPKKFTDVVRLQHFLKTMQKFPDNKIADVVYNCGYYDQAHLNHFFKKSTGVTPSMYKANQNLLAINLMPV